MIEKDIRTNYMFQHTHNTYLESRCLFQSIKALRFLTTAVLKKRNTVADLDFEMQKIRLLIWIYRNIMFCSYLSIVKMRMSTAIL